MIEVSENVSEVLKMLHDFGYILFSPKKQIIKNHYITGNVFCIHKSKQELLKKLNITLANTQ